MLRIRLPQDQANVADLLRLIGFAEIELEVVAFAELAQSRQLFSIGSYLAADHAEVARYLPNIGAGLVEIARDLIQLRARVVELGARVVEFGAGFLL